MSGKVFIVIQIFFISLSLSAQSQNKPLAQIENKTITAREFKLRFEFSPFINKNSEPDSVKYHFLFSLIAEKLFAVEARNRGFEQSDKFEFAFKPIEKLYVRDALFNKEVKSKINIDALDILKGINRYTTKLQVEIFSSKDSAQIYKIFSELESGVPIDSLIDADEKELSEISFGDIKDESLEDSLFSLFIGENTEPVKTESGWFLFYLKNKVLTIASKDEKSTLSKVETIIRDRRTEKAYYNFMEDVFNGKIIEADEELFIILSEEVINILKQTDAEESDSFQFYLNESDFEKIKIKLDREILDKIFFTVDDQSVYVKDFLADLFLEGFSVNTLDKNVVFGKMNRLVKNFIEKEYLTNLGYQQGLQNIPEVRENLEMWKDNYLAQLYKNTFTDSARSTDDEVYNYFLEQQKEEQIKAVNIIELLTDSLEVIEYVLNQLEEGVGFKELAAKFTKREWTKDRGGEFGFFPVTMFDEIGKIADAMEKGEIYGPIKVNEGYSIFQLIDIKEETDSIFKSFSEAKETMRSSLFYKKMNDILTNTTIELARKYKINIDEGVLNSINTTKIKMFVHRLMGFGGRIAAVPFTTPWYEWINELELKGLLP